MPTTAPPRTRSRPATGSGGTTTTGARRSDVRAVVGAFPEPFVSGVDGKRLPVRLDCADDAAKVCDEVADRLADEGIKSGRSAVGGLRRRGRAARSRSGRWARACGATPRCAGSRRARASRASTRSPRRTGARSRCSTPRARRVRTLGPGGGLIAATRLDGEAPTWVVTGTDAAGVAAAAAQLQRGHARRPLRDRRRGRPAGRAPGPDAGGEPVTYLRRASPLHAARARGRPRSGASCWPLVALSFEHPLVLVALLATIVAAAAAARVGRRVLLALAICAPVRAGHRARQPARRPRRPDRDRAAGDACPCSASSTSPREATAYGGVLGAARAGRSSAASRCTRPRSTRTSCCARSAASPSAPR